MRPKNRVPGLDVAGTVVEVGSAVTRFAMGDEVFGISRGSFAQYAAVREDKLAPKPANLSFEQAAVVPVSAGTALQALTDAGRVEAGQRVLVIGASGGVGSYAVQLAKALAADVTAVCSTAKLDFVASLGADHVIDYTSQDFAAGPIRYDLVLDIGGNTSLSRLRRALTPRGTLVIVGGEAGGRWTGGFGRSLRAPLLSLFVTQRLTMLASKERASDQARLTAFIEAGDVTPSIDRTYPLSRVPDAMRYLESGASEARSQSPSDGRAGLLSGIPEEHPGDKHALAVVFDESERTHDRVTSLSSCRELPPTTGLWQAPWRPACADRRRGHRRRVDAALSGGVASLQ